MKRQFFKRWNWEYDYGEDELRRDPGPNCPHAVAHYDGEGRLYRVVVRTDATLSESSGSKLIYDYFCDDSGRVVEKRSLDEGGVVVLLVRFVYGAGDRPPKQVAFNPKSGAIRSAVRKDYLKRRAAQQ